MILIADSGSTKCDWLLMDAAGNALELYHTMGFNPYFHCPETVEAELKKHPELSTLASGVDHVFFYGAGASSEELCARMRDGLERVFTKATIVVDHDLLGAAYAVYDGEPCIACILGTGSNSCRFDGKELYEEVPALAYILGDEGSGSWFGKQLLRAFFYKQLPEELRADFVNSYAMTKELLVEKVYNNAHANVWLASFMPFLGKHKSHPLIREWVKNGMRAFIRAHVHCYADYKELPVHFVGSVAYHFNDLLQEVCTEEGVRLGKTLKQPVNSIAEYHVKHLLPQLMQKP